MTELFQNVSDKFKERLSAFIDIVIYSCTVPEAVKMIWDFAANCSEEEKDFIEFYLRMKMEKLPNESNHD